MDTMQTTLNTTLSKAFAALLVTILSACTSIPTQLQGEFAEVSPARVQTDVFGTDVRWGGVLVDTRNEEDRTCFEVLSRALDRYLRPQIVDTTSGRFIACTDGFQDPEIFAKGREVTITGQIKDVQLRKIEEFDYRYPVLDITDMVLWEERKDRIIYTPYYDPFYYPYYWGGRSWGYYPYHRYPGWSYGSGMIRTQTTEPRASTNIRRER